MRRLVFALALLALAGPAPAQAPLRHIAVVGETAPGTGGGTYVSFEVAISSPPFTDLVAPAMVPMGKGDAAFVATVFGGTASQGIFLDTDGVDTAVVLSGQPAPGTGGGTFDTLWGPGINGAGTIAFEAHLAGGTASEGIFTAKDGSVTARVVQGDPAPGTGGGTFDAFSQYLGTPIASSGAVAFLARISGGTATRGLFVESLGTVTPIVLEGDAAPGTGGGTFDFFSSPAGNAAGELAFAAWIDGASATVGVFRTVAGGISAVALEGDPAPDTGGGTYARFDEVSIGLSKLIAFHASIAGGTNPTGAFLDDHGTHTALALQGQVAPGSGGGTFLGGNFVADYLRWTPVVDGRRIPYSAYISGGSVETSLYVGSATIAREGTAIPSLPGASLDDIWGRLSGDRGWIAFNGTATGSTTGAGIFAVPALPPAGLLFTAIALLGAGHRVFATGRAALRSRPEGSGGSAGHGGSPTARSRGT